MVRCVAWLNRVEKLTDKESPCCRYGNPVGFETVDDEMAEELREVFQEKSQPSGRLKKDR